MEELERMLELFPEKECPNINSAFRKLHANLMFRSARAMVSISGGADSDMMLDMLMALDPAKNYPFNEMHYVWFDTGIEYTATKQHLKNLEEKYGITIERRRAKTLCLLGAKRGDSPSCQSRSASISAAYRRTDFNGRMNRLTCSTGAIRTAKRPCAGGAMLLAKEVRST